jgi:hypothetical protein
MADLVNPFLFTTRVPRLSEPGHALLSAWGAGKFSALWRHYQQASDLSYHLTLEVT